VGKITPRIFSQYSPQHLSQWDQPLISPIRPELNQKPNRPGNFTTPTASLPPAKLEVSELTKDNIHTFFKPSVVDVVIPLTNISALPAAVMSRDMGTPIRQFVIALDDKHKFLQDLFLHGKIPGVSKSRKQEIWHLRREDISALERFFYLVCGRDSDLVPDMIQMLELHYTASLFVHDPNRIGEEQQKKRALQQEAKVALGNENDADGKKTVKKRAEANETPSKGVVIDVGDELLSDNENSKDENRIQTADYHNIAKNPVKASSSPDVVKAELDEAIAANEHVITNNQIEEVDGETNPDLLSNKIKPIKRRRRDADDDDDDESEDHIEEQQSGEDEESEDYVNSASDDDDGEEKKPKEGQLPDEDVLELMSKDPDVDPRVKQFIYRMFDEERAKQSTQPTNQDIVLFQEEFAFLDILFFCSIVLPLFVVESHFLLVFVVGLVLLLLDLHHHWTHQIV
jgi:hypothetical protein